MPASKRRSLLVTVFGVIGTIWFALHAAEYLFERIDWLAATLALPAPLGLPDLFDSMPQWASVALTVTIWLGLLGAFLLLLGDRASVLVLSLTVIAALVTLAWGVLAFTQGFGHIGTVEPLFFAGAQAAMTIGLWLYARTAKRYDTL